MHDVDGLNAGYARALLEQYLENPEAVPPEWRALFESGSSEVVAAHPGLTRLLELLRTDGNGHAAAPTLPPPTPPPPTPPAAPPPPAAAPETPAAPAAPAVDDELLAAVAAAVALVAAIRTQGHLAARLDPLGSEPVGDPSLEAERLEPELTPELQARIPAAALGVNVPGETAADVLPRLREIYCGTSAYEVEHISDHEQRAWLHAAIESGSYRKPLEPDEQRALLGRLAEVEGFERYLRRAFLGQKQFSIEGLDVMVPMLDEAIALAADEGAHEVVLGMAHRGRLNVLAHVLGRPYETILREFEGERTLEAVVADPEGGTGDVKYHLGAEGSRTTPAGEITVTLASNPSHLEAVDPVVQGRTRAEQTDRSSRTGYSDYSVAMPIQIHGDASFPAQGVVAETLNLANLNGYSTGGTLHLIANNQIGFTTDPADGRSTRYSSDLAKGFDIPIVHVNADDPEAALAAVRLALEFRRRFSTDFVIDLVGYRRHGHNEGDEAAYTQPLMAARIEIQPSVREQYAQELVAADVISQEDAEALVGQGRAGAQGRARAAEGDLPRGRPGGRLRGPHPLGHGRGGRDGGRRGQAARAERGAAARARRLHRQPEARAAARAPPHRARRGRHRLGPGRGAGVREPSRRGHPGPADRPGHRARNLRAPPPRPPRPPDRRGVYAGPKPA